MPSRGCMASEWLRAALDELPTGVLDLANRTLRHLPELTDEKGNPCELDELTEFGECGIHTDMDLERHRES